MCVLYSKEKGAGQDNQDKETSTKKVQREGLPKQNKNAGGSVAFCSRPDRLPSYAISTRLFPGVKRPGRGIKQPRPPFAEVKARVELYRYIAVGLSLPLPSGPHQNYRV
jgi:hypothetical protein